MYMQRKVLHGFHYLTTPGYLSRRRWQRTICATWQLVFTLASMSGDKNTTAEVWVWRGERGGYLQEKAALLGSKPPPPTISPIKWTLRRQLETALHVISIYTAVTCSHAIREQHLVTYIRNIFGVDCKARVAGEGARRFELLSDKNTENKVSRPRFFSHGRSCSRCSRRCHPRRHCDIHRRAPHGCF